MSDQNQIQVIDPVSITQQEIDTQISTARRYPRDEVSAVQKSIRLATYNPKIAQSCIYFRPVGKGKDGRQTFAEGPSIRLAEVLKSSWGNLRLGTRILGIENGKVKVQAVCHDLESNVFETCEESGNVSRRDGSMYSEAQIAVVAAARSKIALRNVIFSVIPKAYAEQILDACKESIVGEDKTALTEALLKSFSEMGIDEARLFSVVDRSEYPAGSNAETVFLIGLHNAIKDGLATVDDVFGAAPTRPPVEMPKAKAAKPTPKKDPVPEAAPTQPPIPPASAEQPAASGSVPEEIYDDRQTWLDYLTEIANETGLNEKDLDKMVFDKYKATCKMVKREFWPEIVALVLDLQKVKA